MRISILVACAKNRVIGRDGDLPWRLSNDLRNFKRLTMGHPIVMGRKTMDSIGRLLPGRQTIILTRDETYTFDGAAVAHSWQDAIDFATQYETKRIDNAKSVEKFDGKTTSANIPTAEVFIVGGAEIYALALPHVHRLYLTEVDASVGGDTFFPKWNRVEWDTIAREDFASNEKNDHAHTFLTLDRK